MRTTSKTAAREGFTLIEMATVIGIIGILLSFILAVSFQGLQVARVRATQALITKLNVALEERLDSLLATPITPNGTHQWLASVNPGNALYNSGQAPYGTATLPWGLTSDQRAYVIARLDQIKAEFPDVFFIDYKNPNYPINFCGLPFNPLGAATALNKPTDPYVLPVGNSVAPGFNPSPMTNGAYVIDPDGDGVPNVGPGNYYPPPSLPGLPVINTQGTGIYGASYTAAASLYRLAGYTTNGTDGVDNDGNGLVDDLTQEGTVDANGSPNSTAVANFSTFVTNHQHKTARAEMLYALLVNGQGPLGSVFEAEDFTNNEVKDTDSDGVPEFVDAWGEPLLFYRWPAYHNSAQGYGVGNSGVLNTTGLQKGFDFYYGSTATTSSGVPSGLFEPRQTNPLDPDRQLTALAWWNDPFNTSSLGISPKAGYVQTFFMPLQEDLAAWTLSHTFNPDPAASPSTGQFWERSSSNGLSERAFFVKFLVSSSGPGLVPGYYVTPDTVIKSSTNADQMAAQILLGYPNAYSQGNPQYTVPVGQLTIPSESRTPSSSTRPRAPILPVWTTSTARTSRPVAEGCNELARALA